MFYVSNLCRCETVPQVIEEVVQFHANHSVSICTTHSTDAIVVSLLSSRQLLFMRQDRKLVNAVIGRPVTFYIFGFIQYPKSQRQTKKQSNLK